MQQGNGEPGGTRTHDHMIKSHVLYQLSYRPAPLETKSQGTIGKGISFVKGQDHSEHHRSWLVDFYVLSLLFPNSRLACRIGETEYHDAVLSGQPGAGF